MTKARAAVVVVLALLGAVLSLSLLAVHHGEGSALDALCGESAAGASGCDLVNTSTYASVGGIPLAALGLAFYSSLALLVGIGLLTGDATLAATAALAFRLLVVALAADAVLLAIQAFAIRAYCNLCLLTYAVNVAALVTLLPARRGGVSRAERAAVLSWIAGSLALGVAAKSIDEAKAARKAERQGTLLGAPHATPDGKAFSGPDGYRLEAQRLQGILDDPQKLAEYLDKKAAREYEEAKVETFDLAGAPMRGAAAAPVTAIEFSDFLCPHCRSLAEALERYLPQSGDRVRVAFKQYPLDSTCNSAMQRIVHPGSCLLALGGICAAEQDRFWQYHDAVFAEPPANPGRDDVIRIGGRAGLDAAKLQSCLDAPRTTERLEKEIAEGQKAGVTGTPTLFVNGKRLPRLNDFGQVVEKEAAKKGIPPTQP